MKDAEKKVVLFNINGGVVLCTPAQAEEIQTKQMLDILNNGFDTIRVTKGDHACQD